MCSMQSAFVSLSLSPQEVLNMHFRLFVSEVNCYCWLNKTVYQHYIVKVTMAHSEWARQNTWLHNCTDANITKHEITG